MTRPTILVTGASGQIGYELTRLLAAHGEVIALDRSRLDLADADALRSTLRRLRPQIVANAAAYTAVDRAEDEPEVAFAVNCRAPEILAQEAKRLGALLVHYSTDYVFDGRASAPYDEDSPTAPLNVYGESKLAGEHAISASGCAYLTLRTNWVYALRGRNFLLTIRRIAAERDEIRVIDDQFGAPNWARSLAEATARLVALGASRLAERGGLYHLTASGVTTWFDFARAIIGPVERPRIVAVKTAEYPTRAQRPGYSVLSSSKFSRTFGFALPDWRVMLQDCLSSSDAFPAS